MNKPKLCFIIPEYRVAAATHFNYLYKLISLLEKERDIFLITECGDQPDFLKSSMIYTQKFRFLPLRFAENFLILSWARLCGYKDFYAHYSFLAAFNSSLLVNLLDGRTFYWNCGLPWLYERSFLREKFEQLIYKLVTFLVTGTEGLKKEYARHYRLPLSKIKVMPNWVDIDRFSQKSVAAAHLKFKLNISPEKKVILFTHRLSKRKGVHYLPEILKKISDQQVVLLVIGDGPERGDMELRIRNYGLSSRVKFLGWVPNRDLADYYALADVFILPSEEEGFPRVLLEAMAAMVPFVAFDVGGVREIVPPEFSKYLTENGDPDGFIEKIKELLYSDSKSLEILKQNELKWVRQFDIKFAVERFDQLLN